MKDILVITTHSFVDLITNSSSELYVCDTNKTIEAVEELLKTLLKNHNEIEGESHVYENVFAKLTVAKYGFQYYDVPQKMREDYEYYHGRNPFANSYQYSFDNELAEVEELRQKEQEINRKHNIHEEGLYERDEKEHSRRWKASRDDTDALWADYGARKLWTESELFLDFLRQNNFSPKQIAAAKRECNKSVKNHIANKSGQYGWIDSRGFTKAVRDAFDTFSLWESYGVTSKKGSILVSSADDNSIPYKLMDTLSSYLNANRYHLG